MTLNREQAIKIINLLDEVKAELTHILEGFTTKKVEKTANQQRAEIIENAKKFVGEITTDLKAYEEDRKYPYGFISGECKYRLLKPEFHINQDKRVVTVLMKGLRYEVIYNKSFAKCTPDDVFNEDIGKAIALGRALELDVSEFENAIQPNEFVKGQMIDIGNKIVEIYAVKPTHRTVGGIWEFEEPENGFTFIGNDNYENWYELEIIKKITNDTNAEYNNSKEGKC